MADGVTIKNISDFFKTGDPKRDSLSVFREEWMNLSEDDKAFFKEEIGKTL